MGSLRTHLRAGALAAYRPTGPSVRSPGLAPGLANRKRHPLLQPPCRERPLTDDAVSEQIEALLEDRGVNITQRQIVATEVQHVWARLSQTGALPPHCPSPLALAAAMAAYADLVAAESDFEALQTLKRTPQLLRLTPGELAQRVLALRLALPRTNVSALLWQRPSLLLLEDAPAAVAAALAQMHALMPGIDFEPRLHEGGQAFWSFSSLLPQPASLEGGSAGGQTHAHAQQAAQHAATAGTLQAAQAAAAARAGDSWRPPPG